jgi:hypothetical protein
MDPIVLCLLPPIGETNEGWLIAETINCTNEDLFEKTPTLITILVPNMRDA